MARRSTSRGQRSGLHPTGCRRAGRRDRSVCGPRGRSCHRTCGLCAILRAWNTNNLWRSRESIIQIGPERFEVVYCLLSLTRNHRLHVHVSTDEETAGPICYRVMAGRRMARARGLRPVRRVYLRATGTCRRILTDYGSRGHPLRKDFPAHRLRRDAVFGSRKSGSFISQSAWRRISATSISRARGKELRSTCLPGDEKAYALPEAKGAPTPLKRRYRPERQGGRDQNTRGDSGKAASSEPYGKTTEWNG